jgi:phosphatidylserine/phosphatidylglycerophosphate/cardiolipin synthase-like enzyme
VFYARLMEDMEAARHSIHLQYFIWRADTFTARVKEILTTKARAGVEVRLLYDPLGSHANLSRAYIREMPAAGVRMVPTSPLYRLHTISYRNHRKITVIDGTIGYTGGMNIGQEHLDGGEGFDSWRDTQVRIVGEATALLQQVELLDRLLIEARETIRTNPEREHVVLQDTMQRHGFGEATARAATRELSRDPERALTVYSRAVLGMNPEELGSPWASALSSLATFAAGALVPLVPWFIATGVSAVVGSLALAVGAALAIGGLLG